MVLFFETSCADQSVGPGRKAKDKSWMLLETRDLESKRRNECKELAVVLSN